VSLKHLNIDKDSAYSQLKFLKSTSTKGTLTLFRPPNAQNLTANETKVTKVGNCAAASKPVRKTQNCEAKTLVESEHISRKHRIQLSHHDQVWAARGAVVRPNLQEC